MSDLEDGDHPLFVVYLVDRPVVAYPDSPTAFSLELATPGRSWVARKGSQGAFYAILNIRGEPGYLLLCPPLNGYRVAH